LLFLAPELAQFLCWRLLSIFLAAVTPLLPSALLLLLLRLIAHPRSTEGIAGRILICSSEVSLVSHFSLWRALPGEGPRLQQNYRQWLSPAARC